MSVQHLPTIPPTVVDVSSWSVLVFDECSVETWVLWSDAIEYGQETDEVEYRVSRHVRRTWHDTDPLEFFKDSLTQK